MYLAVGLSFAMLATVGGAYMIRNRRHSTSKQNDVYDSAVGVSVLDTNNLVSTSREAVLNPVYTTPEMESKHIAVNAGDQSFA